MNRTSSPKRAASAALVAALAATMAFGGLAAAKDHPKPGKGHGAQGTEQVQGGNAQASLKVKGNASHPGGVFRVLAVLKSAKDVRPATMDAVVHFATGDLDVVLTRSGGGAAYHAFVPVPDDEPEGVVMIDATAVVDGETLEATGAGKILDRGDSSDATVQEEETVAPTEAAETCEPSEEPGESASDDPSDDPSGDPGEESSDDPGDESSDDPGDSANADEASDDCTVSQVELTDEIIAAVLEYLKTLFA
jgi:hypothetical protein